MKIANCMTAVIVSLSLQAAYLQAQKAPQSFAEAADIFVFGKSSQTPEQQQTDEHECMQFAQQRTGTNPFTFQQDTQEGVAEAQAAAETNAAPPPEQVEAQKVKGARAAGAARGAVGGAAIGAIAGDTGDGAVIGAVAGTMRGGRKQRQANAAAKKQAAAANQQAQQQYEAAKADSVEAASDAVLAEAEVTKKNFKNAFAVCMQAKDYEVRF